MKEFAMKILMAPLGKTYLFYVGQAGFIVKSKNGQLLGIDLYLSDCGERIEKSIGFKRLLPKILNAYDLELDYIIATHPHFDHFDMDAIPQLLSNQKTFLFASVNCEDEMKRLLMKKDKVMYVKPGDHCIGGDFDIDFVSCDHGTGAVDAVGVVINVDGKKIYMTGDTCLRLDYVESEQLKGIDILLAPINGAYGNMNEQDCARFSAALNPQLTIPCHYGMFAAHGGNPGIFMEQMQKYCPENKYYLMTLGEGILM